MPSRTDSVVFAVIPASWGPVHIAATDRAVVALELTSPTDGFVAGLERRLHRETRRGTNRVLAAAVGQVQEFLDGRRRAFDLPIVIDDRPAWDRAVLAAVGETAWGP